MLMIKTLSALLMMAAIAAGLLLAAEYGAPERLVFSYLALGEFAVVTFIAAFLKEMKKK